MRRTLPSADEAARQAAIGERERSCFVIAGAGTGKTTLLVSRYVSLIGEGLSPSEIAAITFTEKAASDLRIRIRGELERCGYQDAAVAIDGAPISTIHAFCGSLLREKPIEAGLDPNFEQLDEVGSQLILKGAFDRWFGEALSAGGGMIRRAMAAGVGLGDMRKLALLLYANRDLKSALSGEVRCVDVEAAFAEIEGEILALSKMAANKCLSPADEGFRLIKRLAESLRWAGGGIAEKERLLMHLLRPAAKGNQADWDSPASCREQKQRCRELEVRVEEVRSSLSTEIFADLLTALSGFVEYMEETKRGAGQVDFDDLLMLSRNLLLKDNDVLDHFRSKHKHMLVDEAQDNDPLQTEILWLLCSSGAFGVWHERPLRPGKLFLVGDPKQSIYRFRRADIDTFRFATDRLSLTGRELSITRNFRSSVPLVSFINAVFRPILGEAFAPIEADPGHEGSPGSSAVVMIDSPKDTEQSRSLKDLRCSEAEAVASFIDGLLRGGERVVFETEGFRQVRPWDVAVLFPTTTGIDIYEDALRVRQIPFSIEGSRRFYACNEIHAALCVLDAALRPCDPLAVAAALRSVLIGLSDRDLLIIRGRLPSFDYRDFTPGMFAEPVSRALSILLDLHAVAATSKAACVLERFIEMSVGIPIALLRFHGEQAAANLEKLVAIARQLESKGLGDTDRFLRWAKSRAQSAERQDESPLTEGPGERVRLMTVHKAKGLEFPIVVLANLSAQLVFKGNAMADRLAGRLDVGIGSGKNRFATAGFEEAREAEKAQHEAEWHRLLYVAATRARDLLVLPRFIPDKKDPMLWKILDKGLDEGRPWMKTIDASALASQVRVEAAAKEVVDDRGETFSAEMASVEEAVSARAAAFVPGLPLKAASDSAHSGSTPSQEYGGEGDGGRARDIGTAVHRVLERADFDAGEPALRAVVELVVRELEAPHLSEEVCRLALTVLSGPLAARVAKARAVYRELPFSFWDGEALFDGSMDLVLEEAEGLSIVDYKTDAVTDDEVAARSEIYRPQLDLYSKALSAITGRSVCGKQILFLRPGVLYSL